MDTQAPGSFIPKYSMVPGAVGAPKNTGGAGILTMISVVLFLGSVGTAAAAYGYEHVLKNDVASKAAQIEANKSSFTVEGLDQLTRTDARLSETVKLLQSHVAPTLIFDLLSAQTLTRVQFTSFKYSVAKDGSATIDMAGVADSLQTVALQSDKLGEVKEMKDIVISGLTIGEGGNIDFTVRASIISSAILYQKTITPISTTDSVQEIVPTNPGAPTQSPSTITPVTNIEDDVLQF